MVCIYPGADSYDNGGGGRGDPAGLYGKIINIGAANRDVPYIVGTGITMIIIAFVMMAGGIGGAWFASKASISFGADLRNDCFKKVQKFSFTNIDTFSTGSLVTRLTNDITQVQNLIMMALRMMLRRREC